jgi:hypothetical protein
LLNLLSRQGQALGPDNAHYYACLERRRRDPLIVVQWSSLSCLTESHSDILGEDAKINHCRTTQYSVLQSVDCVRDEMKSVVLKLLASLVVPSLAFHPAWRAKCMPYHHQLRQSHTHRIFLVQDDEDLATLIERHNDGIDKELPQELRDEVEQGKPSEWQIMTQVSTVHFVGLSPRDLFFLCHSHFSPSFFVFHSFLASTFSLTY